MGWVIQHLLDAYAGRSPHINHYKRSITMRNLFVFSCIAFLSICFFSQDVQAAITTGKETPIVLVHGFLGFGPDEMLGYNYWGGFDSLQESLEGEGYTVFVAAVGPVSSSWDRACELYAQIKGGQVDYGRGHSAHYRHDRTDPLKSYSGFYPQWDSDHPIHLIGHSQGGQTVRALAQLLEQGHPAFHQVGYSADNEASLLFQGGNSGWIKSITTISTPHDGTSLAVGIDLIPFAQDFILAVASAIGLFGDDVIYDFKLGQFGLVRDPGESLYEYFWEVANSAVFKDTRDSSAWDMDPLLGVFEFNGWVTARSDIYYFSYSTEQTFRLYPTNNHAPEIGMNLALAPATWFMGSYKQGLIDSSWFENDGVVNTISMSGPKSGSSDVILPFDNQYMYKGAWNDMGLLSLDHGDIIGILPYPGEVPPGYASLKSWYSDLAAMLTSLP